MWWSLAWALDAPTPLDAGALPTARSVWIEPVSASGLWVPDELAPVADVAPPTARSVWIEPVYTTGLWVPDELAPVADAVGDALARRGWSVVPASEARTAINRFALGLHPDRDAACPRPPPAAAWLEQRFAGYHRADTEWRCEASPPAWWPAGAPHTAGCRLEVWVTAPVDAAEALHWIARFPLGTEPAQVVRAVRRGALKPASPEDAVMGGLGMGDVFDAPERAIRVRDLRLGGAWAAGADADVDQALRGLDGDVWSCRQDWRWDAWENPVIARVSPDGRIASCTSVIADHADDASRCVCASAQDQLRFPPAEAERRLRFSADVHVRQPAHPPSRVEVIAPASADPTAALVLPFLGEHPALRACAVAAGPVRAGQRWPFRLAVDATGQATSAAVSPALDGDDPALRDCLTTALAGLALSCPSGDGATITGELGVEAVDAYKSWSNADQNALTGGGITLAPVDWVWEAPVPGGRLHIIDRTGALRTDHPAGGVELRFAVDAASTAEAWLDAVARLAGPETRRVFLYGDGYGRATSVRFLRVVDPGGGAALRFDGSIRDLLAGVHPDQRRHLP